METSSRPRIWTETGATRHRKAQPPPAAAPCEHGTLTEPLMQGTWS